MKKYYFIINPLASSGKAAVVWRDCKNYLDRQSIEYEAFMTSYAGHAAELAAKLTGSEERTREKTIVVIGGDGTLGDVINGINISAMVTLGFIPAGSGNDFARSTGISRRPIARLKQIIRQRKVAWLDYGVISYIQGQLRQCRFMVSSGMGLDAGICEGVQISPMKSVFNRLHMGRLVYITVGLQRIFTEKPVSVQLTLDGVRTIHLDWVRYISIHVQPREGGGFQMAPNAECQDGQFDLCIVTCRHRLALIKVMFAALFGRHIKMREVHIMQCVTASFKAEQKVCVHADGEICGHLNEFNVLCERRKLKMIL
ncbi:MAG: YegS/Rv2252/BmrU family lipid kinase [Lachnospiraceae bacterium]|nr:YegS/Rv2252/BmrU family lipid kinase [Lachnospiraceae bacterium]